MLPPGWALPNSAIEGGFTKKTEDLQIEVDHRTRKLTLSVVFPSSRFSKKAILIEQNSTRTVALGPQPYPSAVPRR
jgi:hypothetical protein